MKKSIMLIDSELTNTLLSAGLPANLQGFHFLKEAVFEVIKNPTLIHQLTKKLYPQVGEKYGVSSAIVERSMRHAIDAACKTGGLYNVNYMLNAQYFNENDKPCNGCFIALIVEIVKKNLYQTISVLEEKNDPDKLKLAREVEEAIGSFSDDILA